MTQSRKYKNLFVSAAVIAMVALVCIVPYVAGENALYLKGSFPDGFKLKDPVRFYNSGDLYEYINGQAVFYISYGFKRLEHGVYTGGGKEYTVDVYELGSELSAFGSFRQQRDRDAEAIKVGVECSIIDYLTVFYKGQHYVEIIPNDTESEDVPSMKKLAAHVAAGIPGTTELPPDVTMFPEKDLIDGSERYVDENLLSYTVMGRGLTANYNQGGDSELRVFLALPVTKEAALKVYNGFNAKIKDSSLQKLEEAEGLKGQTPYRGMAIMYIRDQFVFGCLNVKNEDAARSVLEGLYSKLKKVHFIE